MKYQRLGVAKQQKFILSQLWRLEVLHQSIVRAMLSLKPAGNSFPALPSICRFAGDLCNPLAHGCMILVRCSLMVFSRRHLLCLPGGTRKIGLKPTLLQYNRFLTNISATTQFPNKVLGVRTSKSPFTGTEFNP